MAYVNTAAPASLGFAARLTAVKASLAQRIADYRVYRETMVELEALSDRDLNDLGIGRSGIRSIALEAAYGK
ncbi:uncharacterized protein DUF1127 [Pacificibacter maritimus]|uniref:Uncharacterized protein DUF1127 n=1 Tax=Pacificibacter maritimus TaxID=762213 RepID=A0A3N4UMQ1_9RHOB|nr:DUF1127 domain-containing protein [Pacificibacter maritimus]RPE71936.1 uncharacterized protein DUF1127 [Pacificibacter maritimus]